MPDKSPHGKGKHHSQSKKSKAKQRYAATASQQQTAAPIPEPSLPASKSAPPTKVATPKATAPIIQYPYITAELKRTGILAGVILVILIVLALVLS